MERRVTRIAALAALCVVCSGIVVGCFGPDNDDGEAGSGGAAGSGGDAGGGQGGTGATGGSAGFTGGMGAIGGFGGAGIGGLGGFGGDAGASGSAGFGGSAGAGECMEEGDCRLVDERCCACEPPTVDEVRAVRFDSSDFGVTCDALCGACPEPVLPVTVVADCVGGSCTPVELAKQTYTECMTDADCELVPTSCCGFCGQATLQNSYAVSIGGGFQACTHPIPCPAIACPDTEFLVEAFCTADRHCSVRPGG